MYESYNLPRPFWSDADGLFFTETFLLVDLTLSLLRLIYRQAPHLSSEGFRLARLLPCTVSKATVFVDDFGLPSSGLSCVK